MAFLPSYELPGGLDHYSERTRLPLLPCRTRPINTSYPQHYPNALRFHLSPCFVTVFLIKLLLVYLTACICHVHVAKQICSISCSHKKVLNLLNYSRKLTTIAVEN